MRTLKETYGTVRTHIKSDEKHKKAHEHIRTHEKPPENLGTHTNT